ncbi:MAG TPA: ATP-grasp domain-containing protein [Micromonospora sp.]
MSTEDRPRLLLVGMGVMGRPYAARARARGFLLSVVDNPTNLADPEVVRMWQPGDRPYEVRGTGDEAWFAAASAAVADARPDALLAFTESQVMAAALIADELGVPSPGLRAATVSRNKLLQRQTFVRHGIRQPGFRLGTDADGVRDWARERYPVVLKPLSGAGSMGVRVVHDDDGLAEWVATTAAGQPFLCEEFVTGPEYSCELIVHEHRVVFANVTAKVTTPPPFFVEVAHRLPAGLSADDTRAVTDQAAAVVGALRMRSGIAHVETRLTGDGPCLMELAVRTPGDFIMDLTELATGVDLFDAVVAVAAGQQPAVTPDRTDAACVWYPTFPPGTPLRVDELRAAAALPGVVSAQINAEPGQTAPTVHWSLDRPAAFVMRGADTAELDTVIDRVRSTIDSAADSGLPA